MAVRQNAPQAAITHNPVTDLYGFSVWYPASGRTTKWRPFHSRENAQAWLDLLEERVWEEVRSDDSPGLLAVSHGFKPGSVPARLLDVTMGSVKRA